MVLIISDCSIMSLTDSKYEFIGEQKCTLCWKTELNLTYFLL